MRGTASWLAVPSCLPVALGSGPPPSCAAPCQGPFWELSPCPSTERKWGRCRADFSAWRWCGLFFCHYHSRGSSDHQAPGAGDGEPCRRAQGVFSKLVTDSRRRRRVCPWLPRRRMLRVETSRTSIPLAQNHSTCPEQEGWATWNLSQFQDTRCQHSCN